MVDPVGIHRLALEELATGFNVFGETEGDADSCRVRPPFL
jgi:hypothetical protein